MATTVGDKPHGKSGRSVIGRRSSYREGATFGALTFGLVAMLALIGSVANSRMYGVDVIGEYAIGMATVSAVRLISTAKERPALVRELTRLEPRHPRVTGLFVAMLAFSVALTVLVGALALLVTHLLLTGPIGRPSLFVPTAALVAGYVFIGNTGENFDVVFNGFRAGRELFAVRAWMAISFLAISVGLAFAVDTVWGLVIAQLGCMTTSLVHRLFLSRRFMRFSVAGQEICSGFETLPGMIRFGIKIAPGALADGGSNESGTWVVASFGSIADVGGYGRAYLLIKQLTVLSVRLNEMLFPTLVERRTNGDGPGYARAFVDSLRYATIALLVPAAAAAGVAQGVMQVFGPGFNRAAPALAVLLLVPALVALSEMQRVALYSLNRAWLGSVAGFLRFGVTIAFGILLTWKIGAVGAALALVLGFFVDITFCTRIVVPHLEVPFRELWPVRQWLALVLGTVAAFASSHWIYSLLHYPVGIFAGAIVGTVVFLGVLVLGGAINDRDRERVRDVRQNLARRRLRAGSSPERGTSPAQ